VREAFGLFVQQASHEHLVDLVAALVHVFEAADRFLQKGYRCVELLVHRVVFFALEGCQLGLVVEGWDPLPDVRQGQVVQQRGFYVVRWVHLEAVHEVLLRLQVVAFEQVRGLVNSSYSSVQREEFEQVVRHVLLLLFGEQRLAEQDRLVEAGPQVEGEEVIVGCVQRDVVCHHVLDDVESLLQEVFAVFVLVQPQTAGG